MGNEGSVPVPAAGDDEFESQARAPPSATNLSPSTVGIGNGNGTGFSGGIGSDNEVVTITGGGKGKSKGANAPNIGSGGGGGGGRRMMNAVFYRRQQQQQQQQQQSSNNIHAQQPMYPVPGAPPMQPEDMVMMSQEEQDQYYLQQQQQQQQASGNYYQGNDVPNPASAMPAPASTKMKAIMTSPGRKGLNLRSTGRTGATILNTMKSLSLGRSSKNVTASNTKEWETRWDEDDDDDDDEENESGNDVRLTIPNQQKEPGPQHTRIDQKKEPPSSYPQGMQQQQQQQQQQQLNIKAVATNVNPRLGPDGAITPINHGTAGLAATSFQYQQHQHANQHKAHLVTATPDQPGKDDHVEWDTGVQTATPIDYEKPNVQMFMPMLRVLGKGSFGKVVLVQKRVGKETGQLFAMKILVKAYLVERNQIERTRTERKVLSIINHPFIMKLHYAFQTPKKLYLVLDYCPGGELFFHLSRFRRFPERVTRFYAAELLLALGHLHKRGIIYRDLKPENVLLDADGHIKLGDFGLAKTGILHACEGATSMCGTPEYMAPEVLAQRGHGFCVDYWGLGMLIYEMMTGLPPWYTTDRARLFRRLRSAPLDIPTYFSQSSASCVSALLERNPHRRMGVTGIRAAMEHEFFRSISWRALYGRRVEPPIRPCEGWSPPSPDDPAASETSKNNSSSIYMHGDHPELDAATANFDNAFTRMPVETDDHDDPKLAALEDKLNENTFLGFTFDEISELEGTPANANVNGNVAAQPGQPRSRTHNADIPNNTMSQMPTTGHQLD